MSGVGVPDTDPGMSPVGCIALVVFICTRGRKEGRIDEQKGQINKKYPFIN